MVFLSRTQVPTNTMLSTNTEGAKRGRYGPQDHSTNALFFGGTSAAATERFQPKVPQNTRKSFQQPTSDSFISKKYCAARPITLLQIKHHRLLISVAS